MKVLVTGGAGFIGSHLVRKLQSEGCEVVVLDNLSTGLRENLPEGCELIELDVKDSALSAVFAKHAPDMVVHLAGQTMVDVSIKDPQFDAMNNIGGTINVLEAARKNGVKRIVFSSTAAAYGDVAGLPIKETTELKPQSFYGQSKITAETYLDLYHKFFGLDYVVLRFANVYGERQGEGGEGGVISIFTKRLAAGQGITIYGDGEQTRDFIYAGDVAAGIYGALCTAEPNSVYNISTQTEVSLKELVNVLTNVAQKKITPLYGPAREGDIYRSMLANGQAKKHLAWEPHISLEEGLRRTYGYFAQ